MKDTQLRALGRHVAAREDELLEDAAPSEAARRELASHVAQRSPRRAGGARLVAGRRSPRWAWLSLAAAATVALGVFAGRWLPSSSALTFTVGSIASSGEVGTWQSAPENSRLPMLFSDGTRVELEPRARARVGAIGAHGAEIVLESGRAHLDVVPVGLRAPGERPWRVSTGPFSVEVKGTRFDVTWEPGLDELSLELFEGSVLINGCDAGPGRVLEAGQKVRASCARKEWAVTPLEQPEASLVRPETSARADNQPPPDAAPPAVGSDTAPHPVVANPVPRPVAANPAPRPPPRSWRALARAGHYRQAYYQLSRSEFSAECRSGSADSLLLLGDVARLSDDDERAQLAYQALRRRFPGDAAAAQAAFALGRASLKRDPAAAARWFDVYLEERPQGPLAQAALDRLLELAVDAGEPERLREVARAYLDRYPDGPHASDARRILQPAAPAR